MAILGVEARSGSLWSLCSSPNPPPIPKLTGSENSKSSPSGTLFRGERLQRTCVLINSHSFAGQAQLLAEAYGCPDLPTAKIKTDRGRDQRSDESSEGHGQGEIPFVSLTGHHDLGSFLQQSPGRELLIWGGLCLHPPPVNFVAPNAPLCSRPKTKGSPCSQPSQNNASKSTLWSFSISFYTSETPRTMSTNWECGPVYQSQVSKQCSPDSAIRTTSLLWHHLKLAVS